MIQKTATALSALAVAAFFSGCASDNAMNVEPQKPTQVFTAEPINSNNTETHFRAVGYGKSPNRNTARSIAFNAARANLATKIRDILMVKENSETTRKTGVVRENSDTFAAAEDAEFYKQITESTVRELLKNINEYGTPVWSDVGNGEIEFTIGVEMKKADVADAMIEAIEKNGSNLSPEKQEAMKKRTNNAVANAGK